ANDDRGMRLAAAFMETDPGPLEMEDLELSIAIDPASTCEPPDAGIADLGVADSGEAMHADAAVHADAALGGSDASAGGDGASGCSCGEVSSRPARSQSAIFVLLLLASAALLRGRSMPSASRRLMKVLTAR